MTAVTTFTLQTAPTRRPVRFQRWRTAFLLAWAGLVAVQALLWLNAANVAAALLVIAGGVSGIHVMARVARLRAYPISTAMLLGYTLSYFLIPPVATLIEWKPLTYNLHHPVLDFTHAFVCHVALLLAHRLYRKSQWGMQLRLGVVNRVYRPMGLFHNLGNVQIMVMGGIGLCAMMYQVFVVGMITEGSGGALNRIMQAMYPLAYLPYCLLVRPLIGAHSYLPLSLRWKLTLIAYTGVLAMVSIGSNSRALVLIGTISVCLVMAYGFITRTLPMRLFRPRRLIIVGLLLALMQGPVTDLATSMVIARAQRNDVGASELISATLDTMKNRDAIRDRLESDANDNHETWDERYLDNLFLQRLANMKFADATLDLALRQDASARAELRTIEWQRVITVLPAPVLEALGIAVDKDFVTTSSAGDLMLFTVTGDTDALGGFRTGSIFGTGYALFDWLYPGVLAILAFLTYALADAQTTRRPLPARDASPVRWVPVFSPLVVTRYYTWVFYLTSAATGVDSMSGLTQLILRGWIESAVIYTVVFWISRVVVRAIGKGAS
ncbi:hypothetical protein [Cupriavidus agavae]|uniref:Uncharacterized protein n=1 Tax=Cupriavidus agavae TaxID=1001822 RepID=A0A4Q7RF93_9BURK|nr:hypothetical protein [Cupriavidus agavae]RZT31851.1 hypothetical protein EV147_4351 [Cupriavidus agavae]